MSDVTHILSAIEQGDPQAAEQLLPLVYDELRKLAAHRIAQEAPGQTLDATALVHEAYLRLVGGGDAKDRNGRGHFFAAAAEAMRRILVDRARKKRALKRGAKPERVELELVDLAVQTDDELLLRVDEALARLATADPQSAELVKLRFFAGVGYTEAAQTLGISERTAKRSWTFARAWLYRELSGSDPGNASPRRDPQVGCASD